jgi:hypothetical protein
MGPRKIENWVVDRIPLDREVIGQILQGHSLGCRKPSFPIGNIDGLVKTPS